MNLPEPNLSEFRPLDMGSSKLDADYLLPKQKEKDKSKKKEKTFWGKVWNRKKLKKPEQVAVLYLRSNGVAEPIEVETKNGFFNIANKTYHVDRDCIYNMTKDRTPLAIIPEWSLIPYGTQKWHDKAMLEKFAELQDHTLRGIRHAELVRMGDDRGGAKMNAKAIIGLIIAAIIGFAILSQYL